MKDRTNEVVQAMQDAIVLSESERILLNFLFEEIMYHPTEHERLIRVALSGTSPAMIACRFELTRAFTEAPANINASRAFEYLAQAAGHLRSAKENVVKQAGNLLTNFITPRKPPVSQNE